MYLLASLRRKPECHVQFEEEPLSSLSSILCTSLIMHL